MDKGNETGHQPGNGNSSSDFVRKLYKMLEDATYREIVRWTDGGGSFVVLENEKFTKTVLPKHFKHSNFASFVRQLNKYDFHKVRLNNDENAPSPYGPNAWEFKHPEFQEHKKDLLDNIKRKAPAARKPQPSAEDQVTAQQVDLLSSQLVASQQQIQILTESFNELAQSQVKLMQYTVQLQRLAWSHEQVMQRVIYCVDSQKETSRLTYDPGLRNGDISNGSSIGDNVSSSLQEASEILREFSAKNLPDKELEQMTINSHHRNNFSMPPSDPSMAVQSTSHNAGFYNSNELENLVYPVGHTNGINPINSEHIHNIPYPPPDIMVQSTLSEISPDNSLISNPKNTEAEKSMSIWGNRKPMILLVEDDKVCARIGMKFLRAFDCGVETASDGIQAVSRINSCPSTFDLILMDIIMPHLDGVSATVCIKDLHPHIPIIAMTSNIRADDIHMYFTHGMDDVLPKPFTKEGMLRALEKHLPEQKNTVFQSSNQISHPGDFKNSETSHSSLTIDMNQISSSQVKTETLPSEAASSSSSWDQSNQLTLPSPVGNPSGGFLRQTIGTTFNMDSSLSTGLVTFSPRQPSSVSLGQHDRKRTAHLGMQNFNDDGPPEKRQRTFPLPIENYDL
ncbi:Transcription factor SKN7 [Erysiphe neolycopersici]|uniref:Transcription factor n=1 Tax=Erysiphe neolycopersici TaxID=212602 RepID=A0A420I4W2_9PEZI|nr:Transcription factor SKN7 [Erysiphe neolycopersici]